MPRKLIKPMSLREIQQWHNRPEDLTKANYMDLYNYYTKIARTANSRIASLQKYQDRTGVILDDMDTFITRMSAQIRGGSENITLADRLRIFEPGQRSRAELGMLIKATEEFLRKKTSTVSGLRERYAQQIEFMGRYFGVDISEEEAAAMVAIGEHGGVTTDGWYEIIMLAQSNDYQHGNYEDFKKLVQSETAFIDESLEHYLQKIYQKFN